MRAFLLKDRRMVVTDRSIVKGAKPDEFEEVTLIVTPDLIDSDELDPDDVDEGEMFPTNCDWCGALIRCDGEDFFIEPPEVNEPVVVCESCYKVHCEKHEKEQTFGSVLEES